MVEQKGPFADAGSQQRFHLARLERFLGLIERTERVGPRTMTDLARRAAITAYCDCYEVGVGADAQRLMDRFLGIGVALG